MTEIWSIGRRVRRGSHCDKQSRPNSQIEDVSLCRSRLTFPIEGVTLSRAGQGVGRCNHTVNSDDLACLPGEGWRNFVFNI